MMIWPPPAALLLLPAALISLAIAGYTWQRRSTAAAPQLLLILVAMVIWTLGYALELSSPSLGAKLVWVGVEYLGIAYLPPGWLIFALAYTGRRRWLATRRLPLWLGLPALTLLLNWTNPWHRLYYADVALSDAAGLAQLVVTPGPWYWVHIGYSYLCIIAGAGLLASALWQTAPIYRRQVGVVLLGVSAPLLTNIAYLGGVNPLAPLDITPFAFTITGPILAWGLFRYRLLSLAPLARAQLIERMADALLVLDERRQIVDLNPAAQRLLGPAAGLGRSAEPALAAWPGLAAAARAAAPAQIEVEAAGGRRAFAVQVSPLCDAQGRAGGLMLVWHEISAQRQAAAALRDALQSFETIVEQTPLVAIQRFGRDGTISHWNAACQASLGYSAAEAVGRRLQDLLLPAGEAAAFEQTIAAVWARGQPTTPQIWHVRSKGGGERWLYSTMIPITAAGQVSELICMDVDVTELRHAEASLRRQRDYLAALHQLALDWLNRREIDDLLQTMVASAAALLDAPCSELLLLEGDELVVRATTANLAALRGERLRREQARLSWRAHDTGEPAIVEDYAAWPERRPEYAQIPLRAAANLPIMAGQQCLGVFALGRVAGGHHFSPEELQRGTLFAQLAALVLDNASLYQAAQREIAERRQAEVEQARLQGQLLQAQKLEAIGHLAGGIAHDFNNILTVISGSSDLALLELPDGHPARPEVRAIQQSADRAAHLVRQLLAFARRQASQPRVVDLNALVAEVADMLQRLIGEQVRLAVEPAPALGMVRVDPHQFEQLLVNLVINARDAMPAGGTLTIRTANERVAADDADRPPAAPAGAYVALSVSDTGVGISDELRARIFEPYFTTKEVGRGTGLGLAICLGIASQHHGFLTVASAPGQGSRFSVYLPATSEPADPADPPAPAADLRPGSATVLVVEDEPEVRDLAVRILGERGYRVLAAADGLAALEVADALRGQPIDLLLSDMVMPQLDGLELARQLQARRPGMRVLLMSGYAAQIHGPGERPAAAYAFLQKPFSQATMLEQVRRALG